MSRTDFAQLWARPHGVYRCFTSCGVLLYVGMGVNPRKRLENHRSRGAWWAPAVSRMTIHWFDKETPSEFGPFMRRPHCRAGDCERLAIESETPLANRQLQSLPWREGAFNEGRERCHQSRAWVVQVTQRFDVAPHGDRYEAITLQPRASITPLARETYPVRARSAPAVPR